MTYFGTNWTRGELGNVPDENPFIECPDCEKSYTWQGYWKPRYVDGKDWNPGNVEWLCDECLDRAKAEYELHKKKRDNAAITEFA